VSFLIHRGLYKDAELIGRRVLKQGTEKLGHERTDILAYANALAGSIFYQSKGDEVILMPHVLRTGKRSMA
jgi:hypothetical protein